MIKFLVTIRITVWIQGLFSGFVVEVCTIRVLLVPINLAIRTDKDGRQCCKCSA